MPIKTKLLSKLQKYVWNIVTTEQQQTIYKQSHIELNLYNSIIVKKNCIYLFNCLLSNEAVRALIQLKHQTKHVHGST